MPYSSILDSCVLAYSCICVWLTGVIIYFVRYGDASKRLTDFVPGIFFLLNTAFGYVVSSLQKVWGGFILVLIHTVSAGLFVSFMTVQLATTSSELAEYAWPLCFSLSGISILISVLTVYFILDYYRAFGSPQPSTIAPYRSLALIGIGCSTPIIISSSHFLSQYADMESHSVLLIVTGALVVATGLLCAFLLRLRTTYMQLVVGCGSAVLYFWALMVTLLLPDDTTGASTVKVAINIGLSALATVACISGRLFVINAAPPSQQHAINAIIISVQYAGMMYFADVSQLHQLGVVDTDVVFGIAVLVSLCMIALGAFYNTFYGHALKASDFVSSGYVSLIARDDSSASSVETTDTTNDGTVDDEPEQDSVEVQLQRVGQNNCDTGRGHPRMVLGIKTTWRFCAVMTLFAICTSNRDQLSHLKIAGLGPLCSIVAILFMPFSQASFFLPVLFVIAAVFCILDVFIPSIAGSTFSICSSVVCILIEVLLYAHIRLHTPRMSPLVLSLYVGMRFGFSIFRLGVARDWIKIATGVIMFLLAPLSFWVTAMRRKDSASGIQRAGSMSS